MHASVIVICMPSIAKLLQRCYVTMSHLSVKSGLYRGHSTRRLAPTPEIKQDSATKKRGPVSRMLHALDNMTNDVRSRISTFAHLGSGSSQRSINAATNSRTEDTQMDWSIPEYVDYMKYYAHFETPAKEPQAGLEMKHVV